MVRLLEPRYPKIEQPFLSDLYSYSNVIKVPWLKCPRQSFYYRAVMVTRYPDLSTPQGLMLCATFKKPPVDFLPNLNPAGKTKLAAHLLTHPSLLDQQIYFLL